MRQSGCEPEVCKDGEAETGTDMEGGSGVDEECGVDQGASDGKGRTRHICNNSRRPMRGQYQSLVKVLVIGNRKEQLAIPLLIANAC